MTTNNRRKFLAAGGALAALSAVPKAEADPPRMNGLYIHGMVWNRQLAAPMNDWLIRLDARVQVPIGNEPQPAVPGFATLGDDFHDAVGSHVELHDATLKGDQLTINGTITESKTPALIGQTVRIEGKVLGTSVQGLTVTIGTSVFGGAGLLVVIAIIAILIA
ncbi:MAG TPA: hypothetical protein VMH80_06830 [Bryobacteraceae bacterium]|nr:hypothetical protein [Bryobacteraceae bacterium]